MSSKADEIVFVPSSVINDVSKDKDIYCHCDGRGYAYITTFINCDCSQGFCVKHICPFCNGEVRR